jgi:hypothetical protein
LTGSLYDSRDLFDTALQQQLTAAQFTQYRISIYTYSLLNAVFYAPKPLATSLVSKSDVPVCSYVRPGSGLQQRGSEDFHRYRYGYLGRTLNAIDVFLSADYAIPAFLVDQLKSGEEKHG